MTVRLNHCNFPSVEFTIGWHLQFAQNAPSYLFTGLNNSEQFIPILHSLHPTKYHLLILRPCWLHLLSACTQHRYHRHLKQTRYLLLQLSMNGNFNQCYYCVMNAAQLFPKQLICNIPKDIRKCNSLANLNFFKLQQNELPLIPINFTAESSLPTSLKKH